VGDGFRWFIVDCPRIAMASNREILTTILLDALAHAPLEMGISYLAELMDGLKTSILDKTGLIERAWRFTSVNIGSECLFEKRDLEFGSS
jgi:hypothetical protein